MGIAIKKKPAVSKNPAPAPVQEPEQQEAEEVVQHSTVVTATLDKKHPDGSEEQEHIQYGTVTHVKHPALVGISMGMTKNLGDFNSMKFSISLTIPCDPDPEEIEATYAAGREWVDAKVNDLNAEIDALIE